MSATLALILGVAAAVVVALLFVVAGIDKLRHRALLPGVIANYRLLPDALVAPAAALLPLAELVVAALLIVGVAGAVPAAAKAGALIAALLLLVFAAGMAINIARGRRHIDCGCGHAGLRQQLGWGQVARNAVLAIGLLPLMLGSSAPLAVADLAVAAVAGLAVYLLMLLFTTLNAVAGPAPGRARG